MPDGEWVTPKLRSWASIIEEQARVQAIQTASMSFVQPYMAVMPDIHFGRGCCVGAVIPTVGAIIPAAVGVDIGCGMRAIRTQYHATDIHINEDRNGRPLSELRQAIEAAIPLSAGRYNQHVDDTARQQVEELERLDGAKQATKTAPNWHLQLGSLGSGNHFIEVCLDEEEQVWLFLHSGSRGVGNKLAMHHIRIASYACTGKALPNRDLAYLIEGGPNDAFHEYIRDLRWAQRFAWLNRDVMMQRVVNCFERWADAPVYAEKTINCHHNYTEQEVLADSQGRDIKVWLSRKGAISAYIDDDGLIPGSMGTASYVVKGKGNADALFSSPHGAGRQFSRGEAKRTFTTDQLTEAMKGIEWARDRAVVFLDESPEAYKPIDQVMLDSRDLVEVRHALRQILNVKGD